MTFSRKMMVAVLAALLFVMVFDVCAQWSPGKTVINLGDLNLAVPSGSTAKTPSAASSPIANPAGNGSDTINTSMNNTTINNTLTASPIESPQPSQSAAIIDLSNYSKDRRDKNLTGYKNIMYPLAEARGSTTSTTGGGCGCS
jgi:hypothetical protein